MDVRDIAETILAENKLCVLATVSPREGPEAATIRYVASGLDVLFETSSLYEKYRNLQFSPRAALVITPNERTTLQMKGRVKELEGRDTDQACARLVAKFGLSAYYTDISARFMQFKPYWLRVMVDGHYPAKFVELKL
jgi:hypothetical protein